MLRLEILAFQGFSPVSNAFTEEADRLGLTPKGRERKEREERLKFAAAMLASRERVVEFQKQLDHLEQATMEALRENEEQLRNAREELRRIRERAYEITMPDGTVEKVYRDGDKVRTDAGVEVDRNIVRPEDLADKAPSWAERNHAGKRVDALAAENEAIKSYQSALRDARERSGKSELSLDELDAVESRVDRTMPESVRRHFEASRPMEDRIINGLPGPSSPDPNAAARNEKANGSAGWWILKAFNKATASSDTAPVPEESAVVFTPAPSAPNPFAR